MEFRKANLDAFVKKYGIKLGFMSVFSKASAYALQDQPVVNAVIDENVNILKKFQKEDIVNNALTKCIYTGNCLPGLCRYICCCCHTKRPGGAGHSKC